MNARLLLLTPILALSACIGGGETCTLNDVTYDFGETFDAFDGCNQCLCGEGGAISCTQIACLLVEPESDGGVEPEVDAGVEPEIDAGAEPDVDAGVVDAGVVDAGVVDAGVGVEPEIDAGAEPDVDAGVVDAGVVDAGVVDAGVVDAGVVDAGPVALQGCAQLTDQAAHCMCGANNPNRFFSNHGGQECTLLDTPLCTDDCCGPDEMVDPNDYTECVPRGAPYVQNFGIFPPDDAFFFHGYVAGATSCRFESTVGGVTEVTNDVPGPGRSGDGVTTGAGINLIRFLIADDYYVASSFSAECENEFGGVSVSVEIPAVEDRFNVVTNSDGSVDVCREESAFSTIFDHCFLYLGTVPSAPCDPQAACEYGASLGADEIDSCHRLPPAVSLDDGDMLTWDCQVNWMFYATLRNLRSRFSYAAADDGLTFLGP